MTESAWDAPISIRREKNQRCQKSKLRLITATVASIRPDSREFFNPRQIRVTHRPTAGQGVRVYARAECNVRVARLNRYISTARPIEMVDRDRDRLVVFLFRFIDVSLSKLTNSPLRSFPYVEIFFCPLFPSPEFNLSSVFSEASELDASSDFIFIRGILDGVFADYF